MKPHLLPILLFAALHCASAQDPYKKPATEPPAVVAPEASPVLSLREETFVIARKDAPAFLREFPTDPARHEELLRRANAGQAGLERIQLLRTKSGQRSVVEAIEEFHWPATEPGKDGGKPVTTDEVRIVGDTLEVEPVLGPDNRLIDLNLVAQSTRFTGYTEAPDKSTPRQPIFRSRKITTSVTLTAGEPMLIGSLNPPSDSGLPGVEADEKLHLDFITVFVGSDTPAAKPALSRTAALANTIVIPKVQLREATVEEAVEFLRAKARDFDQEKKGLNMVLKAPPSVLTDVKVSLDLTNCPVSEVARYIAQLAGLKLTITDNALVFHPPGEAP
jgi:hypothetical protein